jgi:hypothetical protein
MVNEGQFAAAKGRFKWLGNEVAELNLPSTTHENCILYVPSVFIHFFEVFVRC